MDLIDGYCRLENNTDDTVIYRPKNGVYDSVTSPITSSTSLWLKLPIKDMNMLFSRVDHSWMPKEWHERLLK